MGNIIGANVLEGCTLVFEKGEYMVYVETDRVGFPTAYHAQVKFLRDGRQHVKFQWFGVTYYGYLKRYENVFKARNKKTQE